MNFKSKLSFLFSVVPLGLLAVSMSTPAHADTAYTYTGHNFTNVQGVGYSTADSVSGWFIVTSPLGDNLTDYSVTPTSFSFTDGVQTFNTPGLNTFFNVNTDAAGNITGWFFELVPPSAPPGPADNIVSYTLGFEIGMTVNLDAGETVSGNTITGQGWDHTPGTWTSATVATPEPGSFTLFFSGMLGLGLFAVLKRNRENNLATEA